MSQTRTRIIVASIAAAAVASVIGVGAVVGATERDKYPVVSEKVQQYYDENVVSAKPTLTAKATKTVAFIGDSYTAGSGASSPAKRWSTLLAGTMGWSEVNVANGGTGYANPGTTANYAGSIAKAAEAKPSLIIVSGGRNDIQLGSQRYTPAVADFFSKLRAAAPNAKIIVTSPVWDDDAAPETVAELQDAVRNNAEAAGATYLDIGEPLAGHKELVVQDGIHPNDAGHAAIYVAVKQAVAAAPAP